jgi:outer membrane biosynthesis protein TonB
MLGSKTGTSAVMRAGGVKTMILQTIEPRLLMGLGLAASIIGHLALTLGLLFADAHPFESMPSQAITVDIVAPEQARPLPEPTEPAKPAEPKQPDPIDFSALTAPVVPTTSPEQQTPRQKSQAAAAPASPPTPPPDSQQAAAKPQGTEASQPALSPQASSPPSPSPPAPAPDITVKYGVMLGLPSGQPYNGIEAPAYDTAKISSDDSAAFRRHLKTCSSLPASVAPTDKVRIVLRVLLSRDGTLMAEPALLEASASAKGPALMQKAISALQACQPYTMLPADKYKEWKTLDLSFTPQDFTG